jgi:hypothetical protein
MQGVIELPEKSITATDTDLDRAAAAIAESQSQGAVPSQAATRAVTSGDCSTAFTK